MSVGGAVPILHDHSVEGLTPFWHADHRRDLAVVARSASCRPVGPPHPAARVASEA